MLRDVRLSVERLVERRNAGELGWLVPVDELQEFPDLRASLEDHSASRGEYHQQGHREPVDVEERDGRHHHLVPWLEPDVPGVPLNDVRDNVPVREDGRLRSPGRSPRVLKDRRRRLGVRAKDGDCSGSGDRLFPGTDRGILRELCGKVLASEDKVDERTKVTGVEIANSSDEDRWHGVLRPDLLEVRVQDLEGDERLWGGILQEAGEVLSDVERAHLSDHGPQSKDAEEGDRVGGDVGKVEGDPIPGLHALSREGGGEPLALLPELAVAPLGSVVDDRGAVRPAAHALLDEVRKELVGDEEVVRYGGRIAPEPDAFRVRGWRRGHGFPIRTPGLRSLSRTGPPAGSSSRSGRGRRSRARSRPSRRASSR